MAKQQYLRRAPIREALIDIRVKIARDVVIDDFLAVKNKITAKYPKVEPINIINGIIEFDKEGGIRTTPKDKRIQGYFFKSADEKNMVQFRLDGFTYNKLYPYTNWEAILSEAKSLWASYFSIARPETIERLAVRYINRLDIKLPIIDFTDYLVAPPNIPSTLPQTVTQFLTRMVIRENDVSINLVQAMDPGKEVENVSMILDIDVYKMKRSGFNVDDIWAEFDELRKIKNKVFFESIQEKVVEMYI